MSATGEPITILSEHESWSLLASVALGHLVTSVDGQPEIFPVNFVVQHRTVLFRAPGSGNLYRIPNIKRGDYQLVDRSPG